MENDELDWTQWERNTTGVGANLWYAASPELQFTLGLDMQERKTDAAAVGEPHRTIAFDDQGCELCAAMRAAVASLGRRSSRPSFTHPP